MKFSTLSIGGIGGITNPVKLAKRLTDEGFALIDGHFVNENLETICNLCTEMASKGYNSFLLTGRAGNMKLFAGEPQKFEVVRVIKNHNGLFQIDWAFQHSVKMTDLLILPKEAISETPKGSEETSTHLAQK